jgi:hypothetical protein
MRNDKIDTRSGRNCTAPAERTPGNAWQPLDQRLEQQQPRGIITRSGSGMGSRFSSTAFTTVKMALFGPMPSASTSMATVPEERPKSIAKVLPEELHSDSFTTLLSAP